MWIRVTGNLNNWVHCTTFHTSVNICPKLFHVSWQFSELVVGNAFLLAITNTQLSDNSASSSTHLPPRCGGEGGPCLRPGSSFLHYSTTSWCRLFSAGLPFCSFVTSAYRVGITWRQDRMRSAHIGSQTIFSGLKTDMDGAAEETGHCCSLELHANFYPIWVNWKDHWCPVSSFFCFISCILCGHADSPKPSEEANAKPLSHQINSLKFLEFNKMKF